MVHIYGANSVIVKRRQDNPADHVLDGLKQVVIPDSEHHVMVDQPLALISAIRGVLVGWP
jgi:pimeloyl-ACP methyl ester carboxylesterase